MESSRLDHRRTHHRRTALAALGVVAVGVTVEYRFAFFTGCDLGPFGIARSPSLRLDLKELLGLQSFYSQLGQDKWSIGVVFPGVTDGFVVDVRTIRSAAPRPAGLRRTPRSTS